MHAFDTESWELLDATITGLPDAPASPLLEAVIDPATGHLVYPVRTACCARGTAIERNTAHHRPPWAPAQSPLGASPAARGLCGASLRRTGPDRLQRG